MYVYKHKDRQWVSECYSATDSPSLSWIKGSEIGCFGFVNFWNELRHVGAGAVHKWVSV